MKTKIKWTEQAVSNLESLIKDIERINPRLKEKNVKTIFNKSTSKFSWNRKVSSELHCRLNES